MATHSVNVLIKAQDKAAKHLKNINKATGSLAGGLKKLAAAAAVYLSARAVYSTSKKFITAAAEQEKADALLARSLANVGDASAQTLADLKAFASEIQRDTVYGDEFTQQLISLALNLGVSSKNLKEATKAAIGLSAASGGQMSLETSMKNVSMAVQGNFSALERYLPALRSTKDATKKLAIMQDMARKGFKLAMEDAKKGLGPVTQMWNTLGDAISETIGRRLLPLVQESANKIREWADNNAAKIDVWSQKAAAGVGLVKDTFVSFVSYLKGDFTGGINFALDAFLIAMRAAMDTAILTAMAAGRGIWKGVNEGILEGKQKKIAGMAKQKYLKAGGKQGKGMDRISAAIYGDFNPADAGLYAEKYREAKNEYTQRKLREIIGESMSLIGKIWSQAQTDIRTIAPAKLGLAFDIAQAKYRNRLANIIPAGGVPGVPGGGTGGGLAAQAAQAAMSPKAAQGGRGKPGSLAARESRFLTFAPGSKFGSTESNTKSIAKNTAKTNQLLKQVMKKLAGADITGKRAKAEIFVTNMI